MSNPFYNHTDGNPIVNSRGSSSVIRTEFDLISAGFDLIGAAFAGTTLVTGTNGGVANAYTVTTSPAITSYVTPMMVLFSPTVDNTGASTISISGLAATALKSVSGASLVLGDLTVGSYYLAVKTATDFRLLSITKNYADQLAFLTALPSQTSNAGKFTYTNGTSASFQYVFSDPWVAYGIQMAMRASSYSQ